MSLLPGFDIPQDRPPLAARLAPKFRDLAGRGIYFGTSSWKYEGWLGSIYGESRYQTRGKHCSRHDRGGGGPARLNAPLARAGFPPMIQDDALTSFKALVKDSGAEALRKLVNLFD